MFYVGFGVWFQCVGLMYVGIWVELPLLGFVCLGWLCRVFGFSGFLLVCLVGLVLTVS